VHAYCKISNTAPPLLDLLVCVPQPNEHFTSRAKRAWLRVLHSHSYSHRSAEWLDRVEQPTREPQAHGVSQNVCGRSKAGRVY
jgi:hypothetical protein